MQRRPDDTRERAAIGAPPSTGGWAEDVLGVFLDAGYFIYFLENNYCLAPHFDVSRIQRPRRFRGSIAGHAFKHVDVVRSRRDVDFL